MPLQVHCWVSLCYNGEEKSEKSLCFQKVTGDVPHCNLCRKRMLYCVCALYSLYCIFYFKFVTAALIILIFCLA